jgi:LPS sulfotransferase NodH
MTLSPTVPFVILSTQRTGSTWLATLLDSHPAIAAYEELFLRDDEGPRWGSADLERFADAQKERLGDWRSRRPLALFTYLDELYGRDVARAIGFKLMYNQVRQHPEVLVYIVHRGVKVIHLVRTNLLNVLISRDVMAARGLAHAKRDSPLTTVKITIDPVRIKLRLRALEGDVALSRATLRVLRIPHIEVGYEDIVANRAATLTRIMRFLGLDVPDSADDQHKFTSDLVKTTTLGQAELVANYETLRSALSRTRYARFLQE